MLCMNVMVGWCSDASGHESVNNRHIFIFQINNSKNVKMSGTMSKLNQIDF